MCGKCVELAPTTFLSVLGAVFVVICVAVFTVTFIVDGIAKRKNAPEDKEIDTSYTDTEETYQFLFAQQHEDLFRNAKEILPILCPFGEEEEELELTQEHVAIKSLHLVGHEMVITTADEVQAYEQQW